MAILYRAHYAMINNPLTTESGIHTSAIFGFFNTVFKIFKEENPDYFFHMGTHSALAYKKNLLNSPISNHYGLGSPNHPNISWIYYLFSSFFSLCVRFSSFASEVYQFYEPFPREPG